MKLVLYGICLVYLILQIPTFTKNVILSTIYVMTRRGKNEDKN